MKNTFKSNRNHTLKAEMFPSLINLTFLVHFSLFFFNYIYPNQIVIRLTIKLEILLIFKEQTQFWLVYKIDCISIGVSAVH
jgi:presenilin-like A22 family membrane protease